MSDLVMGLDIGYSSIKMAFGSGGQPAMRLMSSAAAPLSRFNMLSDGSGGRNLGGGFEVLVKGEQWVGGADADAISNYAQALHSNYITSPQYLALFYAALTATNSDRIARLVIGLPVSHYREPEKVAQLTKLLTGAHTINAHKTVTVDHVKVVPQPMGAYMEFVASVPSRTDGFKVSKDTTVLVVDPGHFSFDWCAFRNGYKPDSSGSTSSSGAKILEKTAEILQRKDGKVVDQVKLTNAVRDRRTTVWAGASALDFTQAMNEAIKDVMETNITELQNSLRIISAQSGVDVLVLAGGAYAWCESALMEAWPHALFYRAASPIESNARGFWMLGKHEQSKAK